MVNFILLMLACSITLIFAIVILALLHSEVVTEEVGEDE